jgi:hypothetical protein
VLSWASVAEPDPRLLRRIEVSTAVLLSLAGLVSAWASYQASLWGGVQASHYAKASAKVTEASRLSIIDGQVFAQDAQMFMGWLEAASAEDAPRMNFFERRFTPELRAKFDPWRARFPGDLRSLKLDPNAPTRFPRPEHAEGIQARVLQRAADAELEQGEQANRISDRYVAATVVLSTVLFLGGISPLIKGARIRMAMLGLAALLGIAASVFIFNLPVEQL